MTSDAIAARNRANASKSTGPKTSEGKAVVAGNARRHGATGRPNPESVAAWLSIILDNPDVTIADLMPQDDASYRALVLAEAEARYVAAETALLEFDGGHAAPMIKTVRVPEFTEEDADLNENLEVLEQMREDTSYDLGRRRKADALIKEVATSPLSRVTYHDQDDQRRLLNRYLSEARSRRRRAFENWAATLSSNPHKTPISRNKARIQRRDDVREDFN